MSAVQKCIQQIPHENFYVSVKTDGRQIVVLIGEEDHAEGTLWNPVAFTKHLKSQIVGNARFYTEQPMLHKDEHGSEWAAEPPIDVNSKISVMHKMRNRAVHIDPRLPILYELWEDMREKATLARKMREQGGQSFFPQIYLTSFYWDILSYYYEFVRSTVKGNMRAAIDAFESTKLVKNEMVSFANAVKSLRGAIRNVNSLDALIELLNDKELQFDLTRGLDVVFLSDIYKKDKAVNVLFVGSAHVRRMEAETFVNWQTPASQ